MSKNNTEIEGLRENLALAKKRHKDALEQEAERLQDVQQAEMALEMALRPESEITGSD